MLNNTYSLLCSHFLLFIFHCSPSYVDTAVNSTTFRANFQGLMPSCIYITQTINLCPYGMHTQNLIIQKSNFSVPFCTELGKKLVWLQKTVLYQFSKFAKNHAIKSKNWWIYQTYIYFRIHAEFIFHGLISFGTHFCRCFSKSWQLYKLQLDWKLKHIFMNDVER